MHQNPYEPTGGIGTLQRARYSGHKRFHCLVYQTVTTPDGLVLPMYGPEVGRRHDMILYREIGIDTQLLQSLLIDGKQYCIYGDAEYVLIQVAFPKASETDAQTI